MYFTAHAQRKGEHAPAGAGHAHTNGPRRHVQGTRAGMRWIWVDLRVCIAGQEQGKERATRNRYVLKGGMQWEHPGKGPGKARPRSPRPWLQIVSARAISDRLRLL